MTRVTFSVTSTADRWWVVIEDGTLEFEKPQSPTSFDLDDGKAYAAIYYAQGAPGNAFSLVGKRADNSEFVKIERDIGSNGFAYGHKGFKP